MSPTDPAPRFRTETRAYSPTKQRNRWKETLIRAGVEEFSPAAEITERIDRYLHSNEDVEEIAYSELMEWVFHPNEEVPSYLMSQLLDLIQRTETVGVYGEINPHELAEQLRKRITVEAQQEDCLWTPLLDQWGKHGVGRIEIAQGPHRDDWKDVETGAETELVDQRMTQMGEWLQNDPAPDHLAAFQEFEYWKLTELQLQHLPDLDLAKIRELINSGADRLKPQALEWGSPGLGATNRKLWSEEADQGPFWEAALKNPHLHRTLLQQLLEEGWEEMAPKPPWQGLAIQALDNPTLKPEDSLQLLDQFAQLPSRSGTERRLGGPFARALLQTRMGQQNPAVRARIYTLAPRGTFQRTFRSGSVKLEAVLAQMGHKNPDELLRKLRELDHRQLTQIQGKSITGILQIEDGEKKQQAFRMLGHIQQQDDRDPGRKR